MTTLLAALPVVAAMAIFIRLLFTGRRPKNYPPGPPTLPIIGNIHLMPKRDAHVQFERWARQYGPVYSLILGTKTLVVLSSDRAVKELLDKKSNIYSHRPEMYIGQTICSGDLRVLMMPYDAKWRMCRKLAHSLLNISAAKAYVPYQMLENKQMLYEMTTQPDRFLYNIRRYSNALTTSMIFGWRTPTYEDEKMKQLFDGFSEFAEINQTGLAALADFFPWLRRLPDFLLPVRKKAREMHKREKVLYLSHWLKAKEEAAAGTIKRCFCEDLAATQKKEGFADDQAAYIAGTLLEAGSDTTSSTLYGFVQAMLLFPDVQKKAQQDIDRVVGSGRLPTMEDEPDLQYIRAIVKESLRWMPTTIMGAVPHAVTQDDYYEGYLIPKDAGVVNNVWGIHMDPERYPEPRRFNPDRYKDDYQNLADAAANPDPSKRDQFTFGAGRRICSGMHVAERSLFLGVSRMLWGFNITPKLDAQGKPILPDPDRLTQGFVCMPEEYQATITPRSEERKQMIIDEWKTAERECLDPVTKQWLQSPLDSARTKA
ncbi:O-methylsterigmatocystin oxidoreductase [Diplogelasinospora grovesii]|uniref:O-methylsterigmatocystin oxidoreductase n=1 Tax=Diplogelasinospora grovesii TaxID=303347 RepID=A0AAN6MY35_9PEZI|nr:O-methylsterigmatocystin oxidoreductase [Diplogelasinospora grovesii]